MTSASSSLSGPSRTAKTSPTSSLRSGLPSLMFMTSVNTVSLVTLLYARANFRNCPLVIHLSSSSSKNSKTLASSPALATGGALPASACSPSAAFSFAGDAFSHVSKNLTNFASSIRPSLSPLISSNTASTVSFLACWWYLIALNTAFLRLPNSANSIFCASSFNFATRFVNPVSTASSLATRLLRMCACDLIHNSSSLSTESMPKSPICVLTDSEPSLASCTSLLAASAFSFNTADFSSAPASSFREASILPETSSAVVIILLASVTLACSAVCASWSFFSCASLFSRRSVSFTFSLAMPMDTFK
mmetsp:Transcript_1017/g.1891  ORF Transcript_1017/g.1891 Transcript_1017/m.1891 type:complete len:306 (-) Transcript_1017:1426-2343(-)